MCQLWSCGCSSLVEHVFNMLKVLGLFTSVKSKEASTKSKQKPQVPSFSLPSLSILKYIIFQLTATRLRLREVWVKDRLLGFLSRLTGTGVSHSLPGWGLQLENSVAL